MNESNAQDVDGGDRGQACQMLRLQMERTGMSNSQRVFSEDEVDLPQPEACPS